MSIMLQPADGGFTGICGQCFIQDFPSTRNSQIRAMIPRINK